MHKNNKISDEFWVLYKFRLKKDLESLRITVDRYNKLIKTKSRDATTETD